MGHGAYYRIRKSTVIISIEQPLVTKFGISDVAHAIKIIHICIYNVSSHVATDTHLRQRGPNVKGRRCCVFV